MRFFATVEDIFQISGRDGLVVVAHAGSSLEFRLRPRDQIQLRTPDGRVFETHIAAIEIACGPQVRKDRTAFQLPNEITKPEVPKGTEIWLAKEQ